MLLAVSLTGCAHRVVGPEPAPIAEIDAADLVAATARLPESDDAADATVPIEDAEIWPRLRRGLRMQHLGHPRVRHEIARLQRSPNAFRALMARSEPYLFHILGRVEAAGLPAEIALLPAVESGFRPYAYSPDGATGLWQFMPATGGMLGLDRDWWFDGRRALRPSTRAAIVYLDRLNERFGGDWLLALAAYNAGAGTVARAVENAARRGQSTDFWSLDLPGETDEYVPRLLALAAVVADPESFELDLPEIANRPYFTPVATDGQIDLGIAADLAGLPIEELLALNAGHRRWATDPAGSHELLIPIERAEDFSGALAVLPADKRLRWQRYTIRPGDSLNRIARQFDVSVEAIRQSNGIKGSQIRAGRHLLIPLSDATTQIATLNRPETRQRLHYRVRKGDSLYAIARRYQVSVADLKRWNQVGRYLRPGERLTLFVEPDA